MRVCTVCALKENHPGITIGDDGVCSLCTLDFAGELMENFAYTSRVFEEFTRSGPNPHGEHDCLFMYSGGKDSTYMLDKFAGEYGKRVLSYTFDVPFESAHAAENIKLARERIPATFVVDSDDDNIKAMMREVFNRTPGRPGKYLDEKLPCVSCRSFFVIRAILYAFRHRIPYIVLCADPQQILTMESDAREVIRGFYRTFGRHLTDELFRGELEQLLFADEDELPRIVFPFIAMRYAYDPDRIVAELKAKGLYTSSPMETHCTLFPLLNYYSFVNWDCMFYKLNAASHRRSVRRDGNRTRSTFSITFPRAADLPLIEERLKKLVLDIAGNRGDPAAQERELIDLFRRLDASEDAARFVAQGFLAMRRTAADLGITLRSTGAET
ncbi:OzmP [Streptomyces caatingaensis]|uniref:OzmP n=1 Tax=Streptomyces caatingaensis TaxID=1678637 RepID=A0A0K9XKL3_9ACTN|nr:OzmP [Streptomyces caatingaensis]KNB53182.1 OzmP [Streptomyces caatingaensis]